MRRVGQNVCCLEAEDAVKPYYQDESVTLYHGDCREVLPTLDIVQAIITDPPYGIDYQSAWRIDKASRFDKLANDDVLSFDWLPVATKLLTCGPMVCFCRWDVAETFRIELARHLEVKSQGIWDRVAHGMGDLGSALAPQHDTFWFGVKGTWAFPGTRPSSVYRSMRMTGEQLQHPTQKPESLMSEMVSDFTVAGDIVLDPFAGSGTTLAAAKRLGRKAIGIELNEKYCEVAARRLSQGALTAMFDTDPLRSEVITQLID